MNRILGLVLSIGFCLAASACVKDETPPPKAPETLHDKAAAVGRAGDRTVTSGLEKGLTGAVDKSEDHSKGLAEANKAAEE